MWSYRGLQASETRNESGRRCTVVSGLMSSADPRAARKARDKDSPRPLWRPAEGSTPETTGPPSNSPSPLGGGRHAWARAATEDRVDRVGHACLWEKTEAKPRGTKGWIGDHLSRHRGASLPADKRSPETSGPSEMRWIVDPSRAA